MKLKPRMYMGKTPLRMSLYGFTVTASRDDVEAFADQWPGSGMHGKPGFSAEFDSKGDLVDLSGWAYNFKGDQSALSAFIDDMKAYGQAAMAGRKSNPRRGRFGQGKLVPGPGTHRQRYWKTVLRESQAELDAMLDDGSDPQAIEILREYIDEVKRHVRGESTILEGRGIGKRRYYSGGRFEHRKQNPGPKRWHWVTGPDKVVLFVGSKTATASWYKRHGGSARGLRLVSILRIDEDSNLTRPVVGKTLEEVWAPLPPRRKRNPGTKKRRKIVSRKQYRTLFAKMHRGEITQDQLWDMLHATRKSYRSLPAAAGRDRYGRFVKGRRGKSRKRRSSSRRRNPDWHGRPSEQDIADRFEELAGSVDKAFHIQRLATQARQRASGSRTSMYPKSAATILRQMGKDYRMPKAAIEFYINNYM